MNKDDIYYISPLSDFGFKKCFRDEIVMKGFLNALFKYARMDLQVENIMYLNNESDADTKKKHRVIFDLKYMSRGVSQQGDIVLRKGDTVTREEKKEWDYDIKKVIGVFLFNFNVPGEEDYPVSRHCIVNMSKRGKHISNELFEYWKIQLPHFRSKGFKPEACKKLLEYWLFNLSNMDKMNTTMPFITKSAGLSRLNELGRFHAMSQKEQDRYIKEEFDDIVVIKDVMNVKMQEGLEKGLAKGLAKGRAEGRAEGRVEGRAEGRAEGRTEQLVESIKKFISKGFDFDEVVKILEISADQIPELRRLVFDSRTI